MRKGKHRPHIPSWAYMYDRAIETHEQLVLALPANEVKQYRAKIIKSGPVVEVEIYPIWHTRAQERRAKGIAKTRLSQQAVNDRNARKTLIRKINANFGSDDYWVTLTFDDNYLPGSYDEAKARWDAYVKRLNRELKKRGLPNLRYVYVIEGSEQGDRYHIHAIVDGRLDMGTVEAKWQYGRRNNVRRLAPDDMGLTGLATYITKLPAGRRRWGASKGLKDPVVRVARISKRKATAIARSNAEAAEIITSLEQVQKLCPGARITQLDPARYSDHVAGAYIYARLAGHDPPKYKKRSA